jgi:hypothetical protein
MLQDLRFMKNVISYKLLLNYKTFCIKVSIANVLNSDQMKIFFVVASKMSLFLGLLLTLHVFYNWRDCEIVLFLISKHALNVWKNYFTQAIQSFPHSSKAVVLNLFL